MLISLMMLSFNSFSQTVTIKRDSTITISSNTAKQVAKELVAYDATKLELFKTRELVTNLERTINLNNVLGLTYQSKINDLNNIVYNYSVQNRAYEEMNYKLIKDLKKTKRKNFLQKGVLTVGLGLTTYFLITK